QGPWLKWKYFEECTWNEGQKLSRKLFMITLILVLIAILIPSISFAQPELGDLGIIFDSDENTPQATVGTVRLLILLTILTLAPSFLILTTCFTRIAV